LRFEGKGGRKTKIIDGTILALAYNLVPGVESLPGIPGPARRKLSFILSKELDQIISGLFFCS
jgi:hypothetical protein